MNIQSLPLLFLALIAFLVFATLLVWVIVGLIRSNREQVIASGPLIAEQEMSVPEAADASVLLEVPRFGSDHRTWQIDFIESATNETTQLRYNPLRAQGAVYGFGTMRVPFGRVHFPRVGRYLVRVSGLAPEKDYWKSRIILSRPYLGRMFLQIVGIVLFGVLTLFSLLLVLWHFFPLQVA
ncbi:MAG: hypothetical protein ACREF8_07110 [Chthoniobacterales bacterium]